MLALGKLLELTLAGREPAEKNQTTVEGVRLRWLSEGALEVRPPEARDNGSDVLLSSGIHGNETAPIELLDRLLHDIARGDLKPRARILFLFELGRASCRARVRVAWWAGWTVHQTEQG